MGDIAPAITFLGGTGTVTGSKFLVEVEGRRVLVDCGMFQGQKALRLRNWEPFPVAPESIDAVVLTHAHLDHSGYLPALARDGFRGPVHLSRSTAALAAIVLGDSARLQEEEAAYANRKGFSKHHPAKPLYTTEDAERAIDLFTPAARGVDVDLGGEIGLRLQTAGHILGSTSALLDVRGTRVFVSGDVGRPNHPLLLPPAEVPDADVILVESTYGNRAHEPREDSLERLADVVRRTARRGGIVIVPSFAVDRTEVVLHALRQLREADRIPELPVFVDSPMALDVLEVYRRAIAHGDDELRVMELSGDPFDPGDLRETRTPAESMKLNDMRYPAIILSASGMATGGRVLHHLLHRLGDPRNAVVLVGFQAQGTRGRLLADGARSVKLLGHYVPVRAEVLVADAFSVHADADELMTWLGHAAPPSTAFIVHGEPEASATLRDRLIEELDWNAVVPNDGERVRLD